MNYIRRETSSRAKVGQYDEGLRTYMLSVYNYMCGALALTGIVAMIMASSPSLMYMFLGTPLKWVVMFAPLGIAVYLQSRIEQLSLRTTQLIFWVYAATLGLSLSSLFVIYTGESIARAFFISASVFGSVSLYGYTTKKDLTGISSFLLMGIFGIFIATLVNMFFQSSALQFAVSFLSVFLFTALTAYDTQKIKHMYYAVGSGDMGGKTAVMGALALYLDFINLFVSIVRLMNDRRQ